MQTIEQIEYKGGEFIISHNMDKDKFKKHKGGIMFAIKDHYAKEGFVKYSDTEIVSFKKI